MLRPDHCAVPSEEHEDPGANRGEPEAEVNLKDTPLDKSDLKNVLLVVGPEGGFSRSEVASLKSHKNLRLVKISDFLLRAETAAVFLAGFTSHYLNKHED